MRTAWTFALFAESSFLFQRVIIIMIMSTCFVVAFSLDVVVGQTRK